MAESRQQVQFCLGSYSLSEGLTARVCCVALAHHMFKVRTAAVLVSFSTSCRVCLGNLLELQQGATTSYTAHHV